jgi:GNAT superfamily N-acetyltransferase
VVTITPIDPAFEEWDALLALIMSSFASMDGVIDPPSSAHRLSPALLKQKALEEIVHLAHEDGQMVGCVFCKPEPPEGLYIGKLAVLPQAQGRGIGRLLVNAAETEARRRDLPQLRLETRIELTANHLTFARWGFAWSADGAHAGYARRTFIEMRKPLVSG